MTRSPGTWALGLAAAAALAAAPSARADLAVENGARILFLGDSITRFGMQPMGWVSLVIAGLRTAGVEAQAIGAGIPGDKSNDMLARLPALLRRKPSWLLLSCGVNDVYFGERGVPLEAFRSNVTQIVRQARARHVRVMILAATMIGEDPTTPNNRAIQQYVQALREVATQEDCRFADVHADMRRELDALERTGRPRGKLLTVSGAHLNVRGNVLMATGVLHAFGMDDAALARAKEAWLDIPGAANVAVPLTLRQLDALEARAAREKTSVQQLLQRPLEETVVEFLGR